jgi:hypothetical protein
MFVCGFNVKVVPSCNVTVLPSIDLTGPVSRAAGFVAGVATCAATVAVAAIVAGALTAAAGLDALEPSGLAAPAPQPATKSADTAAAANHTNLLIMLSPLKRQNSQERKRLWAANR